MRIWCHLLGSFVATLAITPAVHADECAFDYQYVGSRSNWGGGATSGTVSGTCAEVRQAYQKYLRVNAAYHAYRLSPLRIISSGIANRPADDEIEAARDRERAERERQQQEAARRAAEEERLRQQQNRYSAAHPSAVDLMRNRLSGTAGTDTVDLPPVSLTKPSRPAAGGATQLRTVAVPMPRVDSSGFNRTASLDRDSAPLVKFELSPTAAAFLGLIGKNIREAPVQLGEKVISAIGLGNHYAILKLAKGLSDEVEQSVKTAADLIGRGYPEPETSDFVKGSEGRVLKVYVSSMSDIPLPEDEHELEKNGRKWFSWLTGASRAAQ